MKRSFDALLFDMDGVLVDVTNSYRKTIQQTAGYFLKREVPISEVNEIKGKIGMNNDWDATYKVINNSRITYGSVKNLFQKIYWGEGETKGLILKEKLLLTKAQLLMLKRGYKRLGIVTGRPREEAVFTIKRFNLEGVFEVLIAKEDSKKEKPYPDPILLAMEKLGEKNVIYIGDSPSDISAAKAASIPSIYVGNEKIGTYRFKTVLQVFKYLS